MKVCLHCGKEFLEKKETAKFCSVSCRVMNNRKQPKKDKITPVQMQVMYNSILEAIGKINTNNSQPEPLGFISTVKSKTTRSFEQYQNMRLECETEEGWIWLKNEILNDPLLSSRQKSLLIN